MQFHDSYELKIFGAFLVHFGAFPNTYALFIGVAAYG